MNLSWDSINRRFIANLQSGDGWHSEMELVKQAGFKSTGPPNWVWYSTKAAPLNHLRENRPASGLTINPDAKQQFAVLHATEQTNEKVKAEFAVHKKALKKKLKVEEQQITNAVHIPEKGYIDASDLPPAQSLLKPFNPPKPPSTVCLICGDAIYFYEQQSPPVCLWCSKIVLDSHTEVC